MSPKMLWPLALIAASVSPVPAKAAISDNGNEFYSECRPAFTESGKPMEFGICLGFLQGVLAREQFLSATKICVPSGATNGQLMDVVLAYMRDNPKTRHLPPMLLILISLGEAYPCAPKAQTTP